MNFVKAIEAAPEWAARQTAHRASGFSRSSSHPPMSKRKDPSMFRLPLSARRTLVALIVGCAALLSTTTSAHAGTDPVGVGQPYNNTDPTKVYAVNNGDTAWMLTSAAL